MKYHLFAFISSMLITNIFMEPMTSIQIQNYDGPIYLHAPLTCKDDVSKMLHISKDNRHGSCDRECSCVSKHTTKCVPINTASESSCSTGTYYVGAGTYYPQCSGTGYAPPQCDTQIYYTLDAQRQPGSCLRGPEYGSPEHCSRDEKSLHRCNKCSC